jgi:hypothetical protein
MTKWKLVPVKPTDEMVWKAEEDSPEFHHGDPWYGSEPPSEGQINAIYSAMLEAAPNPPVLSDERILEIARSQSCPDTGGFWFEGESELIDMVRAIEREILGGGE